MRIKQPAHPVSQLVTWELRDYRGDLERKLATTSEHEAEHVVLRQRLAEVLAEQDRRARIASPVTWPDTAHNCSCGFTAVSLPSLEEHLDAFADDETHYELARDDAHRPAAG